MVTGGAKMAPPTQRQRPTSALKHAQRTSSFRVISDGFAIRVSLVTGTSYAGDDNYSLVAFCSLSDVAVVHVLRPRVLGLEADTRIVRFFLSFLRAPAQFCSIAEAKHRAGELGERAINLIFGALHGQQVDQIQRRAVEFLEHLMPAAPLSEKSLADLPEDLDAVVRAYLCARSASANFGPI